MRRMAMYLLGISCWIAFSTSRAVLDVFPLPTDVPSAVEIAHMAAFCLSFLVIALVQPRLGRYTDRALPWVALMSLILFLALGFLSSSVLPGRTLSYAAVTFLGLSSACGYCQWILLLSHFKPLSAKALLVLGSLASIGTMLLTSLLGSDSFVVILTYVVLCPLAYILLFVNTRILSVDSGKAGKEAGPGTDLRQTEPLSATVRRVLPEAVCAMSLVLIAPISSAAFSVWVGPIPAQPIIAPAAHLCGLVIISIVWFVLKKEVALVEIYGITLPLTASLVVLSVLFSPDFLWVALFLGDTCFFLVSVLMVTTSLDISRTHHSSIVRVYALFAACVYLSDVVQLILEHSVKTGALDGMQNMTILSLLYIVMVPAFYLVLRTLKNARGAETPKNSALPHALSADRTDPLDVACASVADEHNLSPRQRELLGYFARGRDAAHVANALFLSPHTVRSYRKALYAALNVHNQQELIDMVEERERKLLGPAPS